MNIKKSILISFIVTLFIIFVLFYFKSTQVSNIIEVYNNDNIPNKIIAYVYAPFSTKQYEVNKHETIREIINILTNIKVRNKLIVIKDYVPEFKNTYNLILYDFSNEVQNIYIYNRKYLKINNKYYYMVDVPDLSSMYDLIVTE